MRKIFGGSVLLSLVGAIILGGSLAWESTQHSDGNKASVGELEWGMFYVDKPCLDYGNGEEPPEDCSEPLIGPSGNTVLVGGGGIYNGGDFNLKLRGNGPQQYGEVVILSVDTPHPSCNVTNFSGKARNATSETMDILPPDAHGGAYFIDMTVDELAPEDCIGADVFYGVTITIETVGGNPGDVA